MSTIQEIREALRIVHACQWIPGEQFEDCQSFDVVDDATDELEQARELIRRLEMELRERNDYIAGYENEARELIRKQAEALRKLWNAAEVVLLNNGDVIRGGGYGYGDLQEAVLETYADDALARALAESEQTEAQPAR